MAVTFDVNEGTGSYIKSDGSENIQLQEAHWLDISSLPPLKF